MPPQSVSVQLFTFINPLTPREHPYDKYSCVQNANVHSHPLIG